MTEAAHQMTSNPLPPATRKPNSVGKGQGVEIAILNDRGKQVRQGKEGEICVRGENVTKGYLNNEKANKESFTLDGWFRTGDQGKMDEEGYLFITGRIKELINRGGEKIAPVQVDGVMLSHKDVAEAVCFAVQDDMYGQEIQAAVVLKPNTHVSEKQLQEYIGTKVSKFKVPKKVAPRSSFLLFSPWMFDSSRVSPLDFVFGVLTNGDLFCKGDSEDGNREGAESQGCRGVCQTGKEGEGKTLSRERSEW